MGFSVLPTNIGGFNLNSIIGPLASLLGPTNTAQHMVYPADLGSNPAMNHAVIITAFEYQTGLGNSLGTLSNDISAIGTAVNTATNNVIGGVQSGNTLVSSLIENAGKISGVGQNIGSAAAQTGTVAVNTFTAAQYKPLTKSQPLATFALFMPESLNVNYSSSWNNVSLTDELGFLGKAANAYSDIKNSGIGGITPYAKAILGNALSFGKPGSNIGDLAKQSLGVFTNPQVQLLYNGIALREFQLQFVLTPKSSAEAKVVKNICDSFAYYSLPGISGAQVGNSGQFLTPPQIFTVQFKFLGENGIGGTISNIFNNALTSSGLGFLTQSSNPTDKINAGAAAKTFTVNDCVLTDVAVDYTPNGWATYNDGYPVQTVLSLQFKETTLITKQQFKGTAIDANYRGANFLGSADVADTVQQLGGTASDFMTGSNGFGNFGE